jgi:hypothetical protein
VLLLLLLLLVEVVAAGRPQQHHRCPAAVPSAAVLGVRSGRQVPPQVAASHVGPNQPSLLLLPPPRPAAPLFLSVALYPEPTMMLRGATWAGHSAVPVSVLLLLMLLLLVGRSILAVCCPRECEAACWWVTDGRDGAFLTP